MDVYARVLPTVFSIVSTPMSLVWEEMQRKEKSKGNFTFIASDFL
jgi:hypothetical protein